MKTITRQLLVLVSVIGTIIINALANILPINGLNTGAISDRFKVFFVPAGYVFSIWGLIYIGLILYAIYQLLPAQRNNPRLVKIAPWAILSGIANSVWIFLWHYEIFPLTIIVMLILLASLIMVYLKLRTPGELPSSGESWMVRIPFSVYLGWITVATVANATSLLDFLEWGRFGLSETTWMWIMLAAVLIIAALVNYFRRDVAYTLVILWALAGIAIKFSTIETIALPTWITFALVAVTLIASLFIKQSRKTENLKAA